MVAETFRTSWMQEWCRMGEMLHDDRGWQNKAEEDSVGPS